jgi:hypothetical protein
MLNVTSPLGTVSFNVHEIHARQLALWLMQRYQSFYFEPLPESERLIVVGADFADHVKRHLEDQKIMFTMRRPKGKT